MRCALMKMKWTILFFNNALSVPGKESYKGDRYFLYLGRINGIFRTDDAREKIQQRPRGILNLNIVSVKSTSYFIFQKTTSHQHGIHTHTCTYTTRVIRLMEKIGNGIL